MKAALSLGCNQGDRLANLNEAATRIDRLPNTRVIKASSAYENPPLLPAGAAPDWYQLYLNGALIIETALTPPELLSATQEIENQLGRRREAHWAPRTMDIDIVTCGDAEMHSEALTLPHPRAHERAFVLAPLAEIAPGLKLGTSTVLELKRRIAEQLPAWMQIVNVTPDSFSQDGLLTDSNEPTAAAATFCNYLDIGAESTRPNATPVSPAQEWRRLEPVLGSLQQSGWFRPRISIDTRHAETARRAIEQGAHVVNDVSGLQDPAMPEVLKSSDCDIVIMHHCGVPVDPRRTLPPEDDALDAVKRFLGQRMEMLDDLGIDPDRVLIDPGIGFGKTARQSWQILKNVRALQDIGARILIGHSRKSFLTAVTDQHASERDPHTLAISQYLIEQGVDVLRVHNLDMHRAFNLTSWHLASIPEQ